MLLLLWFWQPLDEVIWTVENPLGRAFLYWLFGLGWVVVLATTFQINHVDLFGLRQVWLHFRGRPYPASGSRPL
ncbi:MAG: hypothetical protein U0794_01775 [Isosphaeraceae bacterium]